jgi:hypothetical protein
MVFAQGGIEVGNLNEILALRGASLSTTGASCGQTLAGALSTGTHGSAIKIGAIHDTVRGLHLVVGRDRHVLLERATEPVVTDEFCTQLGAERISNDAVFNAALVSFGTFGLIHAAIVEVEPLFELTRHRFRLPYVSGLDGFGANPDSSLRVPDGVRSIVSDELYHVDMVMNPNDVREAGIITQAIKNEGNVLNPENRRYNDQNPLHLGRADDVVEFVSRLQSILRGLANPQVRKQLKKLELERYPETGHAPEKGVLGELFARTDFPPGGTSIEIGVPAADTAKAVKLTIDAVNTGAQAFAGLVAVRFVPQSMATLAFSRFGPTCTIEIPAMGGHKSDSVFRRVLKSIDRAGIDYTLHWGQALYFEPRDVVAMYGPERVAAWQNARASLLDTAGQATFRNRAALRAGLID